MFGIVAYGVGTIGKGCLFQEIWYILKPTCVTAWGESKGIAIVQHSCAYNSLIVVFDKRESQNLQEI